MTSNAVWWKEIGCARRFAEDIADALRCEKSVLLQDAEDIPWKDFFYTRLGEQLPELNFIDVDIGGGGYDVKALQERFVRDYTKRRGEGYRDDFYKYFSEWHNKKSVYRLYNIPKDNAKEWQTFFAAYAKESKRRPLPPLLIEFPVPPQGSLPERLAVFSWRKAQSRYDFRLFASRMADREGLNGVQKDYLSAFAALLAGTDAELCAEIAENYEKLVFENRYDDLLSTLSGNHAAPADPEHVLALYVAERKGEIERRVWEAQLTTFFPRIETWRARLLDRYRDFLERILSGGTVTDPYSHQPVTSADELELTVLFHQIAGQYEWNGKPAFSEEYGELELLYRARNELAHLHILPDDSLCRLLELFGKESGDA